MSSPCSCVRAPSRATTRPSLADWMQRYVAGDARAFDQLARAVLPRVRRQIRARVGGDVDIDDLVQLTMLRAHAGRSGYQPPRHDADEALVAWFCAIARNTAINALRAQYRERLEFGEGAERAVEQACGDDLEERVVACERRAERHRELRRAIEALPPGQRVVVQMHKLQGRSMAELSRELGVRDGALRVRAHRAYDNLRCLMAAPRRATAVRAA